MVIRKVIIPAAGLGTRLFPATKVQPKEMLPVFSQTAKGHISVKPMVQMVFEQLYYAGLQEFCFVVGKGKRAIEEHFTPDLDCIKSLEGMGKKGHASELGDFYRKLESSTIRWVNQPEPKGFGNAVLMASPFVKNEQCFVHAGDGCIISKNMDYVRRLIDVSERLKTDAAFIVLEIEKAKHYGIVEGEEIEPGVLRVRTAAEKPKKPKTKLAIMAMYVFNPVIFEALNCTRPGLNGEVQLTDAIQKLIDWNLKVYAVKLDSSYGRLDVGSPEEYWKALELSHQRFVSQFGKPTL